MTEATFHAVYVIPFTVTSFVFIFWLKAAALLNIAYISVTEDTFQFPIGWLKAAVPLNIKSIVVTEDTSQSPRGWLNIVWF